MMDYLQQNFFFHVPFFSFCTIPLQCICSFLVSLDLVQANHICVISLSCSEECSDIHIKKDQTTTQDAHGTTKESQHTSPATS